MKVTDLPNMLAAVRSEDAILVNLEIGKDIPILKNIKVIHVPNQMNNWREFDPDFIHERYFAFIANNFDLFQEKIKWPA